ncbi:MAG: aldose 1-epimerase [Acetivibrionales bacterium]|jgi:aldose 1-epimerase
MFEILSGNENEAFYVCKDNSGDYITITLGYKDENPQMCLEATISPKEGSNHFSYKIGNNETIFYDPELPLADYVQGTPVLFPFPNRIEDAMWTWKGKTYLHKKNGIPVQLHSMVYDEKSWQYDEPEFGINGVSLKTFININEDHPIYRGYPFKCMLSIVYRLTSEKFSIEYSVENKGREEMPFGFAIHPYFNKLSGEDGTLICVPANHWYEIRKDTDKTFLNKSKGEYVQTANILPTGRLIDVDDCGVSLKKPVPVGSLDLDHVYTNLNKDENTYIDYTTLKMKINIITSSDFTHRVVYTPQGQPFFCIEPQTCSTDAINLYAKGISNAHLMILPPGEVHSGTVAYIHEYY